MADLLDLDILELHRLIRSGEVSVEKVVSVYLENIRKSDGEVNAYLEVFEDEIRARVREMEDESRRGISNLLYGIPFSVNDNIMIKGKVVSCASRILSNFISPYNAAVISRLSKCNSIILGRTNMDEFGMGSSSEHSAFQITRNPHNLEYVPGGSSGGSAASVAAREAVFALGSDTGGSVRQPAAMCGVVGYKPTYGLISRYGLVAFASSFDQIGVIGKNVSDVSIVFSHISGKDNRDSTSIRMFRDTYEYLPEFIHKIKSGKIVDAMALDAKKLDIAFIKVSDKDVDNEIYQNYNETIEKLKKIDLRLEEIDLECLDYSLPVYYIISNVEAASNLARYDGVKFGVAPTEKDIEALYNITREEGFGSEVKQRIRAGEYILSDSYFERYYKKAQRGRVRIINIFNDIFSNYDILIMPTSPIPAFKIGERIESPESMYFSDYFTVQANITGLPAISVPSGIDKNGLPIGIQFLSNRLNDDILLKFSYYFEKEIYNHRYTIKS